MPLWVPEGMHAMLKDRGMKEEFKGARLKPGISGKLTVSLFSQLLLLNTLWPWLSACTPQHPHSIPESTFFSSVREGWGLHVIHKPFKLWFSLSDLKCVSLAYHYLMVQPGSWAIGKLWRLSCDCPFVRNIYEDLESTSPMQCWVPGELKWFPIQ